MDEAFTRVNNWARSDLLSYFDITQEEIAIAEAVCGSARDSRVKEAALDWLVTQQHEEVEYFLKGSKTLRNIRRVVDLSLPMPIAEEILPHLAALDEAPEKPRSRSVSKRDASPKRKIKSRK